MRRCGKSTLFKLYQNYLHKSGVSRKAVQTLNQVAQTVQTQDTLTRELKSLRGVKDNFRKFLLTLDYGRVSYDGIQHQNALKWLLGQE
ncbi:hypothetical protein NO2_0168 [Candidatus Termititenax persephonae]|uniref:ATPase n=1 Tax=Candidatus Termititenax persephonae TaxID=2218525 RepID=A0A388TEM3_9BACT|nr:hypothetical protein NO2_0168 [Candidatus Termititenax persephonae]